MHIVIVVVWKYELCMTTEVCVNDSVVGSGSSSGSVRFECLIYNLKCNNEQDYFLFFI